MYAEGAIGEHQWSVNYPPLLYQSSCKTYGPSARTMTMHTLWTYKVGALSNTIWDTVTCMNRYIFKDDRLWLASSKQMETSDKLNKKCVLTSIILGLSMSNKTKKQQNTKAISKVLLRSMHPVEEKLLTSTSFLLRCYAYNYKYCTRPIFCALHVCLCTTHNTCI